MTIKHQHQYQFKIPADICEPVGESRLVERQHWTRRFPAEDERLPDVMDVQAPGVGQLLDILQPAREVHPDAALAQLPPQDGRVHCAQGSPINDSCLEGYQRFKLDIVELCSAANV